MGALSLSLSLTHLNYISLSLSFSVRIWQKRAVYSKRERERGHCNGLSVSLAFNRKEREREAKSEWGLSMGSLLFWGSFFSLAIAIGQLPLVRVWPMLTCEPQTQPQPQPQPQTNGRTDLSGRMFVWLAVAKIYLNVDSIFGEQKRKQNKRAFSLSLFGLVWFGLVSHNSSNEL